MSAEADHVVAALTRPAVSRGRVICDRPVLAAVRWLTSFSLLVSAAAGSAELSGSLTRLTNRPSTPVGASLLVGRVAESESAGGGGEGRRRADPLGLAIGEGRRLGRPRMRIFLRMTSGVVAAAGVVPEGTLPDLVGSVTDLELPLPALELGKAMKPRVGGEELGNEMSERVVGLKAGRSPELGRGRSGFFTLKTLPTEPMLDWATTLLPEPRTVGLGDDGALGTFRPPAEPPVLCAPSWFSAMDWKAGTAFVPRVDDSVDEDAPGPTTLLPEVEIPRFLTPPSCRCEDDSVVVRPVVPPVTPIS